MHVLLPPSETKRSGGGSVFVASSLAHADALGVTRSLIRDALVDLSRDEELAAKVLKLGVKNRGELSHNLVLESSGTLPAIERYAGVLYDALEASVLEPSAREWLTDNVSVQSALFGLLRSSDEIPAYRLSGSTRLPELPSTLKRIWADAHGSIDWDQFGWLLDLRSKDYVALAPLPAGKGAWLQVAQRGADGETRALNHFNKAAKGDLVRRLAASQASIANAEELICWAAGHGLEISVGADPGELTLVTELGAPSRAIR